MVHRYMFSKATTRMNVKPNKVKDDVKSDEVMNDVKSSARSVVVEVDVCDQFTNK